MNLKKLVAALCAVIILLVVSGCNSTLDLSLNVAKGDKYNTHTLCNQDMIFSVNNKTSKVHQIVDMNLSMDVKDVDKDKNVTIDYKYDSIKISTECAGQRMEYDSKQNNERNPLSQIYGGIIGKSFTVKLDKKGQVLELIGIDDIINSMIDNIKGSEEQKKAFKNSLNQSFGDNAIKSMIKQMTSYYPDKEIKVGDIWDNKYDIKTFFPISVNNKLQLVGVKDGLLNVDVQSTIATDTKNNTIDFMGVKGNVNLNGDSKGNINITKSNGLVQNGTFTQNISGEIELLANQSIPENINMPITMTSTITYETTKQ
ncbi:hypothetical protein SOV_45390 [Sporomusa ovata DSM 2662]|uniref:Lipoprotein n=1 Tax=Sporomusa ovata TaxID=2378 RepID=A0A0U1KUB2_9FIRM|nr:DUF6263 family protein [Sporomusa ovata]EQB26927.1 hypothetical protein SOV_3c08010 [Sporomusa ovata DSM 2662]CQR71028.1 hypothetical protein SpAn4DRAFT_2006 [Sporomusa ovata]